MTVIEALRDFVALSSRSFENASGTMERVHQTSAEMSLDLLKELGFPAEVADSYRDTHRRFVTSSYGRVRSATEGFALGLIRTAEDHAPAWCGGAAPVADDHE